MDVARPTDKDADVRAAAAVASADAEAAVIRAEGVDDEPVVGNQRMFDGTLGWAVFGFAAAYAAFHMASLNISELTLETWNFRIVHIAGALALGFTLYSGARFAAEPSQETAWSRYAAYALMLPALFTLGVALWFEAQIRGGAVWNGVDDAIRFNETYLYGAPLLATTALAVLLSWTHRTRRGLVNAVDLVLAVCGLAVAAYLIAIYGTPIRQSTGTPFAPIGISFAATAGTLLILELTRRVAGLALVIIAAVFLAYVFTGQYMPSFLGYPGLDWARFFSNLYTDAGILGPTTAVSSTYIILFIIFAAFLQASKVGDYFVNFAFAAAGRARGGPAKVAIFASGLMGMINGTSAGNVVATGSLTIPLMRKVGYPPKSAGAVEAAASTGGQIMPPIMGAGAFIMVEITGIPYLEIAVAAIIPAILYFASIYFMVDFQAARLGMRGMRSEELPQIGAMLRQVYLFIPIIILIYALFAGYSVIRAGTLATASAAVVSWLTPYRMGLGGVVRALNLAGVMSIQIITVCACAGIIVGVISLTGVGQRFSSLLLGVADTSQLLAMVFAMLISILLGMGMPTTAAYAVAASVVAPGLVELGVPLLTAHFFVFYFAVVSAITPPVALASYAAAGISGANPMATSVTSFRVGLAAFIVPFMFFYNSAILMGAPYIALDRAGVEVAGGDMMRVADDLRLGPDDVEILVDGAPIDAAAAFTPDLSQQGLRDFARAEEIRPVDMTVRILDDVVSPEPFLQSASRTRVERALGIEEDAFRTDWFAIARAALTAAIGVFFLAAAVEGFGFGGPMSVPVRLAFGFAALMMIEGGLLTDALGVGAAAIGVAAQRVFQQRAPAPT